MTAPIFARYIGPARLALSGPGAERYVGVARVLLGQIEHRLRLGGISTAGQQLRLADGTIIRAWISGGFYNATIERSAVGEVVAQTVAIIYVETGFVDLRTRPSLFVVHQTDWLDARVYYGDRQYIALSGGCPKWLNEIQPNLTQDDCDAKPFPDGFPAGFPHQDAFYSKAFRGYVDGLGEMQGRHELRHPSVGYGTGRLKLYLQTLLGSVENPDYNPRVAGELDSFSERVIATVKGVLGTGDISTRRVWFPIDQNGLEKKYIAFNAMYSRGLFRTDDYRYWMILIDGNGLKAKELILKDLAEALRRKLIEAGGSRPFAEETKIEAYLLYGATTFKDPITVDLNIFAAVRGDTIHEGWHFNLKGDEARIVTLEAVLQGNLILHWVGRRYKLSLAFNADANDGAGGFEASLVKEEEKTCTPYSIVWAPMTDAGDLIWFQWNYDGRPYVTVIEGDAPVYGFYGHDANGNESYTTIRHAIEFAPPDNRDLLDEIFYIRDSTHICGPSAHSDGEEHLAKLTKSKNGFYFKVEYGSRSLLSDVTNAQVEVTQAAYIEWTMDAQADGSSYGYCQTSAPSFWICGTPGSPDDNDVALRNAYNHNYIVNNLYGQTPGASGIAVLVKNGEFQLHYQNTQASISESRGDCLVFPLSSSDVAYLYRTEAANPYFVAQDRHYYGNMFASTIIFATQNVMVEHWQAQYLGSIGMGAGTCFSPGGTISQLESVWRESRRKIEGWIVSGAESMKLFSFPASQKSVVTFYPSSNPESVYYIPGEPIDPIEQLGKHATLFDPDPNYPRATAIEATESYGGHLAYMESYGAFLVQTAMTYDPILKIKDDSNERFPIAETGWNFLFEGWS